MAPNFPLAASEMMKVQVCPAEFGNQDMVVSRRDKQMSSL